jgi:adenylate kinase family enzyme
MPYKRIMVFGLPGSGKSTFATTLSKLTSFPVYHLDRYFFIGNWVERDYQEFLCIQRTLVARNEWIIDGNSMKSLEMRYSRADVAVYFRYPRSICLWRIFKRFVSPNHHIETRPEGCSEKIRIKLISYLWHFNARYRAMIEELRKKYPNVIFYEIRNDRDLQKILQTWL